MTDYTKLRIVLHRILSGKHEDGKTLERGDVNAMCKLALIFTEPGDGEARYLKEYGLKAPGDPR